MRKTTLLLASIVCLAGCDRRAVAIAEDAAVAPPAPKAAPESDWSKLSKMNSYPSAITFTTPMMTDTFDGKVDQGTAFLALWSIKHLAWTNVAVAKNETTFAEARKDSDAARGKRVCVNGTVIEISVEKTEDGKVFNGTLLTSAADLYRFYVVRSTGTLVAQSSGRLCGFVTGKFDYPNSAGGTGHAIKVVGMFDLPENR